MKKYRYLILAISIILMLALCYFIGKPLLAFIGEPEAFRAWVQGKGAWGILIFMLLNTLQVILALIPGGPFEIGAGYAFGILWGTLLCDIAMSLGGIINFLLSRRYGMKFIELFTPREKIESVRFLKNHKRWEALLFLFFLLPGTPKDLMCYVVGLTKLPLKKWIFINVVGRLPGIILSALSGAALGKEKYGLFAIAIIVLFLLYLLGTYLYNRHNRNNLSNEQDPSPLPKP